MNNSKKYYQIYTTDSNQIDIRLTDQKPDMEDIYFSMNDARQEAILRIKRDIVKLTMKLEENMDILRSKKASDLINEDQKADEDLKKADSKPKTKPKPEISKPETNHDKELAQESIDDLSADDDDDSMI